MSFAGIEVKRDGAVVIVCIDRPNRRNALHDDALFEIEKALEVCRNDKTISIVIAGAGGLAFCAGADLKELAQMSLVEKIAHTKRGQNLMNAIEQHPCFVVAAIEGYCLGGGLELAAACDYRIASATATIGLPEIGLGAFPSWGGTVRIPTLVGYARARQLMLIGSPISADVAHHWGLINAVCSPGDALSQALEVAQRIAGSHKKTAIAQVKELLYFGTRSSMDAGLHMEFLADCTRLTAEFAASQD